MSGDRGDSSGLVSDEELTRLANLWDAYSYGDPERHETAKAGDEFSEMVKSLHGRVRADQRFRGLTLEIFTQLVKDLCYKRISSERRLRRPSPY